jgi:hypothetical protein
MGCIVGVLGLGIMILGMDTPSSSSERRILLLSIEGRYTPSYMLKEDIPRSGIFMERIISSVRGQG